MKQGDQPCISSAYLFNIQQVHANFLQWLFLKGFLIIMETWLVAKYLGFDIKPYTCLSFKVI